MVGRSSGGNQLRVQNPLYCLLLGERGADSKGPIELVRAEFPSRRSTSPRI